MTQLLERAQRRQVNEGQTVMTALAFPRKKEYGVSLAVDGEGELTYGESWDMQSIMVG